MFKGEFGDIVMLTNEIVYLIQDMKSTAQLPGDNFTRVLSPNQKDIFAYINAETLNQQAYKWKAYKLFPPDWPWQDLQKIKIMECSFWFEMKYDARTEHDIIIYPDETTKPRNGHWIQEILMHSKVSQLPTYWASLTVDAKFGDLRLAATSTPTEPVPMLKMYINGAFRLGMTDTFGDWYYCTMTFTL